MKEYDAHMEKALAKARQHSLDAARSAEELYGWVLAAQCDDAIVQAALEGRGSMRKIRNLLHADETFPEEVKGLLR